MEPSTAARDHGNKVSVRVGIPKLKPQTGFFGGKTANARNAKIEPVFQERYFSITVRGEQDMSGETYKLEVPLKYAIVPNGSYIETEQDFVIVYLKKRDPDQSWEAEIRDGLEHAG